MWIPLPREVKFRPMKKQQNKNNLAHLLLKGFYWFDDSLQGNLRKEYEGLVVTHSQSIIMHTIGEGIQRPSAIAERIGVSRQAVHISLNSLVKLGVVDLIPDPDDQRAKIAVLSEKGEPIRKKVFELFAEVEEELGRRIGKTNVANLRKALEMDWEEPYC